MTLIVAGIALGLIDVRINKTGNSGNLSGKLRRIMENTVESGVNVFQTNKVPPNFNSFFKKYILLFNLLIIIFNEDVMIKLNF